MTTIFTIKLIYDKAYKGYVAEVVNLPGCMSQGKTKDEAILNIKESIELCLEVRAELGYPLTVETQQIEVFA